MKKILLDEKTYEMFEDCRNFIQELMQRKNIEIEDLEFIEETISRLNSSIEF